MSRTNFPDGITSQGIALPQGILGTGIHYFVDPADGKNKMWVTAGNDSINGLNDYVEKLQQNPEFVKKEKEVEEAVKNGQKLFNN